MQNQEEEEAADWEIEESDIQESWVLEEQARGESSGAADSSPGANNEAMNDDAEEMDANEGFVELKDDSIQGFFGHEGEPVYSVAVHPLQSNMILSGGGNDQAFLWNAETGETMGSLPRHQDSVISVGFSVDGQWAASGGMDGRVFVASLQTLPITDCITLEGPDEVTWIRWHPRGPVLMAGSHDGTVWMWNIPTGGQVMGVFAGVHTDAVNCGDFTVDGKQMVTASLDASFALWDPKNTQVPIWKISSDDGRWHQAGITSMGLSKDGQLILTGAEDGGCRLVQKETGKILSVLAGHSDSVESISFCDVLPVAASASMDGQIIIWDLTSMQTRLILRHDDGATQMQFLANSPFLLSTSVDRTLRLWDARNGQCMHVYQGHQDMILSLACSPNQRIVTGGEDGVALVFPWP